MRKFIKSGSYAWTGFFYHLKTQHAFRVEFAWCVAVLILFIVMDVAGFNISGIKWLFFVLSATTLLRSETINTAVEQLADVCERKKDIDIMHIKDMASSYVMIAIGAFIIVNVYILVSALMEGRAV